ncbi:DUF4878 domain-containing protein [Flavobacterium sp. LaA7.5]|nr:DUF4878 domain-containing protein [Flavobacterium salilacus subsp. altitudinum]
MKKSFNKRNPLMLFVALLSMSMFVSCSENGPEKVAKNFLELTSKGEFEKAKEYCDEDTAALLAMAESLGGKMKEEMKDKNVEIKILSSEINEEGNKATVKYTESTEGEESASGEKSIDLVKIDDDWKVSMDKEGMKKEDGGMMPPPPPADMEAMDSIENGDVMEEEMIQEESAE